MERERKFDKVAGDGGEIKIADRHERYKIILETLRDRLTENYNLQFVPVDIFDRKNKEKIRQAGPDDFLVDMPSEEEGMLSFFVPEGILFRGATPQSLERLLLHEVDKIELDPSPNEPNASISWATAVSFGLPHSAGMPEKELMNEPIDKLSDKLLDDEYLMPYNLAVGFPKNSPGIKSVEVPVNRGGSESWNMNNRIVKGSLQPEDIKFIIVRFSGEKNPKIPVVYKLTPKTSNQTEQRSI